MWDWRRIVVGQGRGLCIKLAGGFGVGVGVGSGVKWL